MFIKGTLFATLVTLFVIGSPVLALADTSTTTPDSTVTFPAFFTATTTFNPPASALTPGSTSSPQATITTPVIINTNVGIEAMVRAAFPDVPAMAPIAKCESNFRQFFDSGNVLDGGSGGMIGIFQINKSVHAKFALTLGDDINTIAGNIAYARYLYTNEGTTPWASSEFCWGSMVPVATTTVSSGSTVLGTSTQATSTPTAAPVLAMSGSSTAPVASSPVTTSSPQATAFTTNLKVGMINPQVLALQQVLNKSGYQLTNAGAGSPGQETTKFGALTRAAVQRFQCAQNIVCSGSEGTTGYGYVGPHTRAALMLSL